MTYIASIFIFGQMFSNRSAFRRRDSVFERPYATNAAYMVMERTEAMRR